MSPNEYNEDIFSLRERETIVTDIRSITPSFQSACPNLQNPSSGREAINQGGRSGGCRGASTTKARSPTTSTRTSNPAIPVSDHVGWESQKEKNRLVQTSI